MVELTQLKYCLMFEPYEPMSTKFTVVGGDADVTDQTPAPGYT